MRANLYALLWLAVAIAGFVPAAGRAEEPCDSLNTQPDWDAALVFDARWAQGALVIDLEVAPCFHAYPAQSKTGRPLHLELHSTHAIQTDGPIVYPPGKKEQGPFGERVVVRGKGQIRAPVRRFDPEVRTLKATLHFHACTDRSCGPPQHVKVRVKVPAS